MKINECEKACLSGIRKAFRSYKKMSGGYSLLHAPESFIQAFIGLEISKLAHYVTLESGVATTLENAYAEATGNEIRNGRIDIVTWYKKGERPHFLIELKKANGKVSVKEDIARLRGMRERGGSTKTGLMVIYGEARSHDTLQTRCHDIANEYDIQFSDSFAGKYKNIETDKNVCWMAACFRV